MGADGAVFGVLEEALAGGILAEAVGEAGHGVEPAPVDGERAHAVEGRGLPVDGAGGGPGGAPDELILADLVRGERGGAYGATEEGGEMRDPAAGGVDGPELPDLVVLEVGVAEVPQSWPLGAERARRRCGRGGGRRSGLAAWSRVGPWTRVLLPGRHGRRPSVHIRSGGPHREGESAEATGRRCAGQGTRSMVGRPDPRPAGGPVASLPATPRDADGPRGGSG